jgi:diguanylate cyclase (GGDEF)-like protein
MTASGMARRAREEIVLELIDMLSNTYEWRLTELEAELAAERKKTRDLEAKIETDALVNVLNRRGFERELNRAITCSGRYQTSAAVIFLDLDNFKAINDRWGHPVGDETLQVAKALSGAVRASDIVARVGGDEFAILLWHVNASNALAKARAIERVIEITEIPGAGGASIGASAGTVMIGPFDRPDEVMTRVDAEMYMRKSQRARGTKQIENFAA